jgi:hypothetical protein
LNAAVKRTLFAVGVAVLVSLMLVPFGPDMRIEHVDKKILEDLYPTAGYVYPPDTRWPFFAAPVYYRVKMDEFLLQTAFITTLAAVIVNLFPRRPRK